MCSTIGKQNLVCEIRSMVVLIDKLLSKVEELPPSNGVLFSEKKKKKNENAYLSVAWQHVRMC